MSKVPLQADSGEINTLSMEAMPDAENTISSAHSSCSSCSNPARCANAQIKRPCRAAPSSSAEVVSVSFEPPDLTLFDQSFRRLLVTGNGNAVARHTSASLDHAQRVMQADAKVVTATDADMPTGSTWPILPLASNLCSKYISRCVLVEEQYSGLLLQLFKS